MSSTCIDDTLAWQVCKPPPKGKVHVVHDDVHKSSSCENPVSRHNQLLDAHVELLNQMLLVRPIFPDLAPAPRSSSTYPKLIVSMMLSSGVSKVNAQAWDSLEVWSNACSNYSEHMDSRHVGSYAEMELKPIIRHTHFPDFCSSLPGGGNTKTRMWKTVSMWLLVVNKVKLRATHTTTKLCFVPVLLSVGHVSLITCFMQFEGCALSLVVMMSPSTSFVLSAPPQSVSRLKPSTV